jgi:hypothetical protein
MKRVFWLLALLPSVAFAESVYTVPYGTDFVYCKALYGSDGTTLATGLTLQAADCKVVEQDGTTSNCSASAFTESGTTTGIYCGTITAATMSLNTGYIKWVDDSAGGEFLDSADAVRTFCDGGPPTCGMSGVVSASIVNAVN